MLTGAQKRAVSRYAAANVSHNDSYHSLSHLKQTARLALTLADAEGADRDACWAAAMLHDIRKESEGDHGKLGADAAAEFLRTLDLPGAFIDRVHDAIQFHNKDFEGGPKERMVLWDADKLPLMSPKGFLSRMLPYWEMKKGKAEALGIAIGEYRLFLRRFHTGTARERVEKDARRMERLFSRLEAGSAL